MFFLTFLLTDIDHHWTLVPVPVSRIDSSKTSHSKYMSTAPYRFPFLLLKARISPWKTEIVFRFRVKVWSISVSRFYLQEARTVQYRIPFFVFKLKSWFQPHHKSPQRMSYRNLKIVSVSKSYRNEKFFLFYFDTVNALFQTVQIWVLRLMSNILVPYCIKSKPNLRLMKVKNGTAWHGMDKVLCLDAQLAPVNNNNNNNNHRFPAIYFEKNFFTL